MKGTGFQLGFQFQSWLGKAKVWGGPPEWMKIVGSLGFRFWVRVCGACNSTKGARLQEGLLADLEARGLR